MLEKTLIEFGLTEKEAQVYTALLELEIASVNEIAKSTGINRSSTYVIIESLKRQGLVSVSDDKKIQQFIATTPDVFLRLIDESSLEQEKLREKMHKVVPELKALYRGTKEKPRVRVYEGKQGLINAFEDTLQTKEKKIRVSSSGTTLFKVLPNYLPMYIKLRREKGIKMYSIHPDDKAGRILVNIPPTNFDSPLLIPKRNYPFPADLAIYDDKIAYMSLEGKGIAIVIESKEMADVMKSVFDLAFEEAKRLATNK